MINASIVTSKWFPIKQMFMVIPTLTQHLMLLCSITRQL